MKFVIAVVILAVAIAAQASVAPFAYPYDAHFGGYYRNFYDGAWNGEYFAPRFVGPRLIAPYSHAYAARLPYFAPRIVTTPLEPSYVAANRGSVHVAPLPGHTESTSAINLEPAPGTL